MHSDLLVAEADCWRGAGGWNCAPRGEGPTLDVRPQVVGPPLPNDQHRFSPAMHIQAGGTSLKSPKKGGAKWPGHACTQRTRSMEEQSTYVPVTPSSMVRSQGTGLSRWGDAAAASAAKTQGGERNKIGNGLGFQLTCYIDGRYYWAGPTMLGWKKFQKRPKCFHWFGPLPDQAGRNEIRRKSWISGRNFELGGRSPAVILVLIGGYNLDLEFICVSGSWFPSSP
jgi:hypothetical protein